MKQQKRYSVRRLGEVSWIDTDNLKRAREEKNIANRIVGYGHRIIDNRLNKIID